MLYLYSIFIIQTYIICVVNIASKLNCKFVNYACVFSEMNYFVKFASCLRKLIYLWSLFVNHSSLSCTHTHTMIRCNATQLWIARMIVQNAFILLQKISSRIARMLPIKSAVKVLVVHARYMFLDSWALIVFMFCNNFHYKFII